MELTREQAIEQIKAGLKRRSKLPWSVRGGRGTSWGWITIKSPPKRQEVYEGQPSGSMTPEECAILGKLMGFAGPVHHQGIHIADSRDYYQEHIDRAHGRKPSTTGKPYWD